MVFELAGFLFGVVGIGTALLLLYRRQANRAMDAIHEHADQRARV